MCPVNKASLVLLVLKSPQIETLVSFYTTIGLTLATEQHGKGPVHYSAQVGGTVLELYPASGTESPEVSIRLGFSIPELDQTVETLRSAGAPIIAEPKKTEWGTRTVVRDPDGRAVELYQQ